MDGAVNIVANDDKGVVTKKEKHSISNDVGERRWRGGEMTITGRNGVARARQAAKAANSSERHQPSAWQH